TLCRVFLCSAEYWTKAHPTPWMRGWNVRSGSGKKFWDSIPSAKIISGPVVEPLNFLDSFFPLAE
ncbi:hypothetical protein, partial [Pseudotabrizicola sp.]|uniref:hypothetical protein n=1 Tax=Pseudotabrizicola sp. TaxID=2939647 RepID=UPI00271806EE